MKETFITISTLLVLFSFLTGCGSAEAIEQYNYRSVTKFQLENAITHVLENNTNPNIIWDTADMIVRKFLSGYKQDTLKVSRDKGTFVFITIKGGKAENNYAFRYLGSEDHWKKSPDSEIFITSVWNDLGLDLRQGENVGEFSNPEAKKATKLFEQVFLSKVDKELNMKHTTGRSFWQ